jgi:hypothetical protein
MDLRRFFGKREPAILPGDSVGGIRPFFAAVPLTIEGMVERGISYFKPKISDHAKLEKLTTDACIRPKIGYFSQMTG